MDGNRVLDGVMRGHVGSFLGWLNLQQTLYAQGPKTLSFLSSIGDEGMRGSVWFQPSWGQSQRYFCPRQVKTGDGEMAVHRHLSVSRRLTVLESSGLRFLLWGIFFF